MKACVVVIYLGKLPKWIDSYVKTCSYSKNVHWKIFSDDEHESSENVDFIKISHDEVRARMNLLGFDVGNFSTRKLCDFKPTYGNAFKEYLVDYDYWGMGDLDLFYGDVDKFINEKNFNGCEIYTTRRFITGHGTFFKNCEKVNNFFKKIPNIDASMKNPKYVNLDEKRLTKLVRKKKKEIFVKLDNCIAADGVYDKPPFSHVWDNGTLKDRLTGREFFYVHFMKTKRNQKAKWNFEDKSIFYLNQKGITYEETS